MNLMKYLVITLLAFGGTDVSAGFSAPELLSTEPAQPRANQQFDLVYTLEFCGDRFAPDLPQNRVITIAGSRIVVTSKYYSSLCFEGQQYVPQYSWRMGNVPAGTYQLELRAYNEENGPDVSFPIAVGEVTVLPGIPAPGPNVVPAAGAQGLLILAVLTVLLAMGVLRKR